MTIKEILTQFDRIHEDSSYFCIDTVFRKGAN